MNSTKTDNNYDSSTLDFKYSLGKVLTITL